MPELPEVEALAHHLRENAVYRPVARVDVAEHERAEDRIGPPVSRCARPGRHRCRPVREVPGRRVRSTARTSRCTWSRTCPGPAGCAGTRQASAAPPKPGRGPLALRVHLDTVGGPVSTSPRPARRSACRCTWWPTRRRSPGSPGSDPDALVLSRDELAELLAGRTERIKTLIVDQSMIAGIGNAYSDEILHTARLSPYAVAGRLRPEQIDDLHAAMTPSSPTPWPARSARAPRR